MKKYVSLLIFQCLSLYSFAQYGASYLKVSFETSNNESFYGYLYLKSSEFDRDSTEYDNYLLPHLTKRWRNVTDQSYIYYDHDIKKYNYTSLGGGKSHAYITLNHDSIKIDRIQNLSVLEEIEWTYIIEVLGNHNETDTSWMNSTVVKNVYGGYFLCEWNIMVHQESTRVMELLNKLKSLETEFLTSSKELSDSLYNSDLSDTDISIKQDDHAIEYESKAITILGKLAEEKVIVVLFCSC